MSRKRNFRRRTFLAGAAAALLAGSMPSATARAGEWPSQNIAKADESAVATLIDVDACTGCGACVSACRKRSAALVPLPKLPIPIPKGTRVQVQDWSGRRDETDSLTPYNWLYIQSCTLDTPDGRRQVHLPRRCMHCINPPCVSRCATGAMTQSRRGPVSIDHDFCIGEADCLFACPWMIPRRQSGIGPYLRFAPEYLGNGQTYKCDFCQDTVDKGAAPLCVAACPTGAMHFGPYAEIVRRAAKMAEERDGDVFGYAENGGTHTLYVFSLPFRDIEAALLKQDGIGPGRPSLRPAGAAMARQNRLLRFVIAAPFIGASLACLRVLRERNGGRR